MLPGYNNFIPIYFSSFKLISTYHTSQELLIKMHLRRSFPEPGFAFLIDREGF
jgi:hypothetical protein